MPKTSKYNKKTTIYRKKVKKPYKKGYKKNHYKKKLRRRLYPSKSGSKSTKARKRSNAYKIAKGKGCKFSIYCDLAEFLALSHFDIEWVLACAMESAHLTNDGNGNSVYTTASANIMSDSREILKRIYSIFPTEVMNRNSQRINLTQLSHMYWTAHSYPFKSRYYGPLFNNYVNMYQRIRPVGIKVSYKPNITFVNQIASKLRTTFTGNIVVPHYNESINGSMVSATGGNSFTLTNTADHPKVVVKFPAVFDDEDQVIATTQPVLEYPARGHTVGFNAAELAVHNEAHFPEGAQVPPIIRLWVNFSKQGYEPYHIHNQFFNMNTLEVTAAYRSTAGRPYPGGTDVMQNSRYAFARVYDENGNQMFNSQNSPIKSYALNRPFKFYVRPFLTKRLYEPTTNTNVLTNVQEANSDYVVEHATNKQNDVISGLQKFPYVSIPIIDNPYGNLENSFPKKIAAEQFNGNYANECDFMDIPYNNLAINYQFNDDNYVNPILFSTLLTCDNMLSNSAYSPFTCAITNYKNEQNYWSDHFYVMSDYFIHGMGKFKVTFYCKFKNYNGRLQPSSIDRRNATNQNVPATAAMVDDNN